jgi:hypothetical protein
MDSVTTLPQSVDLSIYFDDNSTSHSYCNVNEFTFSPANSALSISGNDLVVDATQL